MKSSFDKIICVGKNYLDHAIEMGGAIPEEPMFFFKPPSCLVSSPKEAVKVPHDRGSIHHECEIVFRICQRGGKLDFDAATLGLDLTLRDVQNELKKKGAPWEASKAFPSAAVIGPWVEGASLSELLETPFQLSVNGAVRQQSRGTEMRVGPAELLRVASRVFDVRDGDLLFTGTPKGVGPIQPGDRLELKWGERLRFEVLF